MRNSQRNPGRFDTAESVFNMRPGTVCILNLMRTFLLLQAKEELDWMYDKLSTQDDSEELSSTCLEACLTCWIAVTVLGKVI